MEDIGRCINQKIAFKIYIRSIFFKKFINFLLNKFLEKVLGFLLQLLKQIDNFSRIKGLISQMI